ncbi:transcription regulators [Striga asiatica]|uniref:Transcription regulators n=1 Tax=Striga asiatica TaxID=4170 RepID=A0A5A7QHZ2_STRAF|nr:transcription regulators [Striga asiatica]
MIPLSSKVSGQICFLLQSLNDSNSDSVFQELCKCSMHGLEGSILLLQTCWDHLNIYDKDLKTMKLHPIYASVFKHILDKPNFSTVLSESLRTAPISEELLQNLSGALHLSMSEKIGIGLALSNSENHDIRICGRNFCMNQIAELCVCANPEAFESTEKIQNIIMFLNRSEGLSKHVDSFMQMLSLVRLKDGAQFILAPFLPDKVRAENFFRHLDMLTEGGEDDFDAILAEMENEISMADVMRELGYGCTVNVSQCKEILSIFLPLSEVTIAKILGTVARTYTGLEDSQNVFAAFCSALGGNNDLDTSSLSSWNVEVLVESIKQLAPGINWINVMENLDHEGFYIPNEAAFSFFMSVFRHGCQDPFPLHAICGFVWKNIDGQLSFLKYAVSVPPEVFTFAHSDRQLSHGDAVTEPFEPGKSNHAWLCLDLLEMLCQLSERGHASLVRSVLEKPLNHCPELLLLGMAHVNTAYNLIQNEVASAVLPMVLRNASGRGLIFNLWHVKPDLLLRGLIDVMSLDPENVYGILDACQELKILSPVLDMIPFYFSIRLAAFASKKEIMDLENWLSTTLLTSKDAFYEECLKFLKDVQIGSHDVSGNRFHPPVALLNIYMEACPTVLKVLQSHAGVVSSSNLSEEIEKMDVSHMLANSRVKNGTSSDSATADSYADDIETESNQIFHQMFSGQRSIDDMIQMLTRFKESSDKREQSIYECMIANLFEEFKFFTKYPEKQLRIAAILFGSLIKHQLVTHLTLGIALRAVLDSLRKPSDSKMFSFGTKALEQFVDRLVEWPQYCNHILQISHLRATHSELVAFVERTLNRISEAHHETNVHNVTSDHHHGLIQSSSMNLETTGSSYSLVRPGTTQMGLQISSPINLPQRLSSSLDERKTSAILSNYMKPAPSSSSQPGFAPSSDTTSIQKNAVAQRNRRGLNTLCLSRFFKFVSTFLSKYSPSLSFCIHAFSRFGSALNIETLVAAAERRETSIEDRKDNRGGNFMSRLIFLREIDKYFLAIYNYGLVHDAPDLGAYASNYGNIISATETQIYINEAFVSQWPGNWKVPASEIQDKISFIINNLSAATIEAKAKEFTEILNELYYPWFAQYMVMKRASIEMNFHDLYLKFLDKVNLKPLYREIVQATYVNCKVLLGSELIKSSVEERSLLKNLGSWLGKITIGRNQVLRAREIDPKSLIIEAYERGLMIAVIPFTSKILEPCSNSLAYQPPNPWTMGILGLLAEIYAMPNLKMNLKFEIEVLFKNLGVDLKDVTPTSLLKDKVREVEGNPDFSNKDMGSSQPPIPNEAKSGVVSIPNQVEVPLDVAAPAHSGGHSRMVSQFATPLHHSSATLTEDEKMVSLGFPDQLPSAQSLLQVQTPLLSNQLPLPAANVEQQVVVNKKLQAYGLHVHFQSILPIAMDRAVKEIVSSIVQRSVSIATQTTKELVLKDYAMEPDETLIRNAAHLMVARLAGSLAHVTCKEPLRGSISGQLRNALQSLSITSDLLEQAVQLVTNDNLDLGCVLIEQAATEKAVQTIDGEIAQQLSIRRKHRESVGPTFFDASLYAQGQMGVLPEALRPKPGHLSHSQQRVYEDFARFPGQTRSTQGPNSPPVGPSASPASGGMPRSLSSVTPSGQISPSIFSSGLVNAGLGVVPQTLELDPDDMDSVGAQISASVSSPHIAIGDDPQSLESDAVTSFPPASSTDLQVVEPLNSVNESAISVQPLNALLALERPGTAVSDHLMTTGDALDKYQTISEKLETLVANDSKDAEIQGVIAEVPAVILRCISRDEAALAVAQKAFKGLYENASNSAHVNAHLAILAAIRDVSKLVVKELTSWVMYSEEDRKYNKDITIGLIRSELLNLAEYNVHMAKLLDSGRNKPATEFAVSLIQALVINDSKVISELHNLVDALAKARSYSLAARPGSPESLQQLVEIAKNPANAAILSSVTVAKEDSAKTSKDKMFTVAPAANREEEYNASELMDSDLSGFHEQVSVLFAEWYQICELPGANDAASARYVLHLQQRGLLKGDETSDHFFRRIMELSLSHCLSYEAINSSPSQSHQGQPLSFLAIDIYAKLVFSVLKFCPVDQGSNKLSLLPKVLAVTVKFIQKDAEEKKIAFNPRPYFRLFINWLLDLCSLEPVFDGANFQVLTAVANSFHAIQPLKVPGFSFAWLELVSHRSFMPKLLTANAQKGWPYFQRLLVDLFQFMEPFLRNAELGEPAHFLYKGTLRVLLVLLHDFPEFLCDYHFSFCDVIPPSCIQMRNIILSAFPRNMRLPDPSTPNLKIDLLAEISQSPRILPEVDAALKAKQIKNEVDEYLKTRQQGSSFLSELKQKLLLSPVDAARAGTRYNVPLINSLVLYVGMQAIQQLQARAPSQSMANMTAFLVSAALDIFQSLIMDLDTEGRYLFLNAVANQLRYPNNHTHYFSFILLYLFAESNQEMIQEQITRVLLERLIVNRPHPWGLLITFIELIKNPRYNFWSRSFTRCAPEIEKLFESVSRSCGGPKPVDDSVVSGGIAENMH